jgi:hypothetical protein
MRCQQDATARATLVPSQVQLVSLSSLDDEGAHARDDPEGRWLTARGVRSSIQWPSWLSSTTIALSAPQ